MESNWNSLKQKMGMSGAEEMERLLNLVAPMPSAKSTSPKMGRVPATPSPDEEVPKKLLQAFDEMITTYGALKLVETIGVDGPVKNGIVQVGRGKLGDAAYRFITHMLEWADIDVMEKMTQGANDCGR